jgi:hypothetical protein
MKIIIKTLKFFIKYKKLKKKLLILIFWFIKILNYLNINK